jgi:hypothetical protein
VKTEPLAPDVFTDRGPYPRFVKTRIPNATVFTGWGLNPGVTRVNRNRRPKGGCPLSAATCGAGGWCKRLWLALRTVPGVLQFDHATRHTASASFDTENPHVGYGGDGATDLNGDAGLATPATNST